MKRMLLTMSSLLLAGITACGHEASSSSLQSENSEIFDGLDANGTPCHLALFKDPAGNIEMLALNGTFLVNYRIPTVGSGLYGEYRWEGSLSSVGNFGEAGMSIKRSWLNDADVVKGRGKPLFWDTPAIDHKLVAKPSLAAPQTIEYSATQRVVGVIPLVEHELKCKFD